MTLLTESAYYVVGNMEWKRASDGFSRESPRHGDFQLPTGLSAKQKCDETGINRSRPARPFMQMITTRTERMTSFGVQLDHCNVQRLEA
jgi:hypothetical protein